MRHIRLWLCFFLWFLMASGLYFLQSYQEGVQFHSNTPTSKSISDFPEKFYPPSTSWCAPREKLILDPDTRSNCTSNDRNIRIPCLANINSWPLADWFNNSKVQQFKDLIHLFITMDEVHNFKRHYGPSELQSFLLDGLMCFSYDFPYQGMSRESYFQGSIQRLDYEWFQFNSSFWDYFPDGEAKIFGYLHHKESPPMSDKDAHEILYVTRNESTFTVDYQETERSWEKRMDHGFMASTDAL